MLAISPRTLQVTQPLFQPPLVERIMHSSTVVLIPDEMAGDLLCGDRLPFPKLIECFVGGCFQCNGQRLIC